jgi:hypothetical protein
MEFIRFKHSLEINMMAKYKNYVVIGMLLFFVSCARNNNAQPELELINQEVFYVETNTENQYMEHSYEKTEQRINATNLVTFKVSNPTDKKILFVINESLWYPFDGKIQKSKEPGIFFVIKDSASIAPIEIPLINFVENSFMDVVFNRYLYNDSIKKMKYELIGVNYRRLPLGDLETIDNVIKGATVLYPNETRTFHVLLKLPIVNEVNFNIGELDFAYIIEINKFNKFQLYYSADAEYLKSILPEYFLNELDENEIEIFDGILMSNEVPLVMR